MKWEAPAAGEMELGLVVGQVGPGERGRHWVSRERARWWFERMRAAADKAVAVADGKLSNKRKK